MSKKRFSEGLEDLLSDSHANAANLSNQEAALASALHERRGGHKNFMSNLDSLLQEALEESIEKYESNQSDTTVSGNKSKSTQRKSDSAVVQGLDALIRQTIDVEEMLNEEAANKRRITVAVEKNKVDKLKTIARLENAYLKDLLVSLIDQYIEEYAKNKGMALND